VVGCIDFKGDGMDIPNNTLLAAKARRLEKEVMCLTAQKAAAS
jgi:hypothetical protein